MSFRRGGPPGALPNVVYNPPVIWTQRRSRRILLYAISALSAFSGVAGAWQAYGHSNPSAPLSDVISFRHRMRDEFVSCGINLLLAASLIRFDRRRARAEQGLICSQTANDWCSHPLFTAGGRVRWSVSFWHALALPFGLALLVQVPLGIYDAVEALFDPPSDHFFGWTHTWYGTLAGTVIPGMLGACILWYDLRRLRRESRAATGHCVACGYDLRGSPDRCPECGTTSPRSGSSASAGVNAA
jgi:hypothetical protein